MSNYSSLKATINANVKQNNNQEITGNVLNSVLNQMVTSLGAGYLYKGKATPSGSPGSPDNNVFYMAEPGTYTNYGNAVVPDGHIGMLSYDGSWHLDTFRTGFATEEISDGIVQLLDGGDPIYPITKTAAVKTANNTVLETIVKALDLANSSATKGYLFRGIATPSTNPGTPEQPVFYIAAPGSYTHFGNSTLTVNDGYIGVIKWGGSSWSLDQIKVGDVDTVKFTEQALTDAQKLQARKNIGAADEQTVKRITGLTLTPQAYATGSTLPTAKTTAAYYSLLVKAAPGTQFVITGYGGGSTRLLWAIYNEDGTLSRGAATNANTLDNPANVTLAGTEFYLVVNTREGAASASLVQMVDVAANLQQMADNIKELDAKIGKSGAAEMVMEQGYLTTGGAPVDSTTRIRTASFIEATDGIAVNPGIAKYRVYGYDAAGGFVQYINYTTNPAMVQIAGAVKYKLVFGYMDNADITPADYPSLGATVDYMTNGVVVRVAVQNFTDAQKAQARKNIGAADEQTVNPVTDAEGKIEWTLGQFLRTNGTLIETSAKNKVGKINIQGYKKVEFNYLTKAGGSVDRYGYTVTDGGGNILLHSDIYPSNRQSGPFDAVIELPETAVYLNISWTSDANDTYTHYLRCHADIGLLYDRVAALEGGITGSDEEANIENAGVRLYMTVRYNNIDYSYTRLPYATRLIQYPSLFLPSPILFSTKVDATAISRTMIIADNSTYENPQTISLDLVSENIQVYNLEPGKDYYYKVYKDSDTTAVIDGGKITVTGQLRQLRIDADPETNGHDFLDNVRDLGGWAASNNRKIRYGLIFRGETLNGNDDESVVYITNDGKQELRRLGVSAELDLRGNPGVHTSSVLGNDVAYVNFALSLWFYYINIYNSVVNQAHLFADAIRQILAWLEAGKGIYIHCAGGCDRTGALCAMIEGLCGVSENDINHDYEISNRSRARAYYHIEDNTDPQTNQFDGDFKYAMEYIKGLIEYNGHIYVYYRGSYYDAEATVTDYTPVPLTDASLIANLAANNYGSLQDRFERLMCGIGNLTRNEAERLRTVLLS